MKKSLLLLTGIASAIALNTSAEARRGFGLGDGSLPEALAEFDVDGDGVLSDEEKEAVKAARAAKRQAIIDEFDADGDGALNAEERAAAKAAREAERAAARAEKYAEIDTDGVEGLSAEELAASLGEEVSEERAAAIFDRLDADDDGSVSLEEFTNPSRGSKIRNGRGSKKRGSSRRGRGRHRIFVPKSPAPEPEAGEEEMPAPEEQ